MKEKTKAAVIVVSVLGSLAVLVGVLCYDLWFSKKTNFKADYRNSSNYRGLNKENFLKVTVGMTAADVKLILGEPLYGNVRSSNSLREPFIYEYVDGNKNAKIFFDANGIVIQKDQSGL